MAKKKSTYEIIPRDDHPELYAIMDELIVEHHDELREARIAIAYRHAWKPDPDGRMVLGQMKKASDLDRQLHNFDFVMLLNYEVWQAVTFSDEQKRALVDHELCHGALAYDTDGEPRWTPDGRRVYRIRKHTIEEFHEIVERHGQWKGDIQSFVERAMAAGVPQQLTLEESRAAGIDSGVTFGSGKGATTITRDDFAGKVVDRLADALADPASQPPALREAAERLRPKKGGDIESVTISRTMPDGSRKSATLKAH